MFQWTNKLGARLGAPQFKSIVALELCYCNPDSDSILKIYRKVPDWNDKDIQSASLSSSEKRRLDVLLERIDLLVKRFYSCSYDAVFSLKKSLNKRAIQWNVSLLLIRDHLYSKIEQNSHSITWIYFRHTFFSFL